MALRITCPGCKTALTLDDDKRGRKVRCDHCDKMLSIPEASANGKKEKANPDAVQEGRKLKTKAAAKVEQEDEDEEKEEERPAKKKKKKKQSSSSGMLLIAGAVGIIVVLILAVGASAYFLTRSEPAKQVAKADGNAPKVEPQEPQQPPPRGGVPIVPGIKDGNPDSKKGGSSIVNSVRGAGYRTERRNELRQIGLFFQQYCDGTPKSARTKENFLEYIKRDSKVLHENITEGYYVMNMRADNASSTSIIAYERDLDRTGHLAVKGDLSVDYVPLQELKAAVGK